MNIKSFNNFNNKISFLLIRVNALFHQLNQILITFLPTALYISLKNHESILCFLFCYTCLIPTFPIYLIFTLTVLFDDIVHYFFLYILLILRIFSIKHQKLKNLISTFKRRSVLQFLTNFLPRNIFYFDLVEIFREVISDNRIVMEDEFL